MTLDTYADKQINHLTKKSSVHDFFLEAFLEKLHIERHVIVGHSFGGYLATEFAIHYTEKVVKLILVAPA